VPYGYGYGYGYGMPVQQQAQSATASLVWGILSIPLVFMCYIGFIPGIVAIVLGRKAMAQVDQSGGQLGGRSQAKAGFICGIVGIALNVLWFGFFAFLMSASRY